MASDLDAMMARTAALRDQLEQMQAGMQDAAATVSVGNGLVTMTLTMHGAMRDLRIDPRAVDPRDVGALEALIREAHASASAKLQQQAEERLRPIGDYLGEFGQVFGGDPGRSADR
ncbi:YbaB/EbfC family nucleoid-associated protein [Dactylosporangium sp. CA-152071]|uniref:YbaB/EbfC family nucleoid-associated protein n=1 Tax=Dactylosporangium sp. CA-152071 TaxID=3239933 RepID=UPI003D8DF15A